MENVRGVNLGGWLVLERWISPSVFSGTLAKDEYSLMSELGPEEAAARIRKHRDNFINEEHIERLYQLGITTLRVPIGYWLFGGIDGFVDGAEHYVDVLFGWAARRDMTIILDFHAAPGSQNGWDHSGKAGDIAWIEDSNIEASCDFLEILAKRYGQNRALIGIELLNEPHWSIPIHILGEFYQKAGHRIEQVCHPGVAVVVSDAFRPDEITKLVAQLGLSRVVVDCHLYQLFTEEDRGLDFSDHIKRTDKWARDLRRRRRRVSVLVGEWSAALNELHDPLTNKRQSYKKADYETYASAQIQSFATGQSGWCYWTARTEDGGVWSLLDHPQLVAQKAPK